MIKQIKPEKLEKATKRRKNSNSSKNSENSQNGHIKSDPDFKPPDLPNCSPRNGRLADGAPPVKRGRPRAAATPTPPQPTQNGDMECVQGNCENLPFFGKMSEMFSLKFEKMKFQKNEISKMTFQKIKFQK